nr:protein YIF1B-like [Tanacetum cinerariifolium]
MLGDLIISRYFSDPQYYFQVNDRYVRNKLKVVLFPFLHRGHWTRFTEPVGGRLSYKPLIYDINAPDLYIPLMAFGTYVVLAGFSLGLQGKFTPEGLNWLFMKGIVGWFLQVLLLKMSWVNHCVLLLLILDPLDLSVYGNLLGENNEAGPFLRGLPGFDDLVMKSWSSFVLDDSNGMIRFKKKLQILKKEIHTWTLDYKRQQVVLKQLHDVQSSNNHDIMQKAKIRWAIEGDENSKYFHAIINKKRVNLSVKGVMVDGDWIDDPDLVKQEFRSHFADRFQDPGSRRDLESPISKDKIRTAVWGCGVDKSPGQTVLLSNSFASTGPLLDLILALQWN